MGQFHCDFDPKQMNQFKTSFDPEIIKNPISVRSVYLGKKTYIDVVCDKEDTQQINKLYHIRCKGIPNSVFMIYCEDNNIAPDAVYEKLYKGEQITMDLLSDQKRMWAKKNPNSTINQVLKFNRTLKF